MALLLTSSVSIVNFERVIDGWESLTKLLKMSPLPYNEN